MPASAFCTSHIVPSIMASESEKVPLFDIRHQDDDNDGGESTGDEFAGTEPVVTSESKEKGFVRSLSLLSGVSFIVGSEIGSGIFSSPGSVLVHAGSVGMSLIAWVFAGLLALLGCACYAELGTMIPESGGEYSYILRVYGKIPAYLYSWTFCLVINSGGMAIISLVTGQYAMKPFYIDGNPPDILSKSVAVFVLILIVIINSVSVHWSALLQRWATYTKLAAIGLVTVVGLVYLARAEPGSPAYQNLGDAFNNTGA